MMTESVESAGFTKDRLNLDHQAKQDKSARAQACRPALCLSHDCETCAPQSFCTVRHRSYSLRTCLQIRGPETRTGFKNVVPSALDEARREQAVRVAEMLEEVARSQEHGGNEAGND